MIFKYNCVIRFETKIPQFCDAVRDIFYEIFPGSDVISDKHKKIYLKNLKNLIFLQIYKHYKILLFILIKIKKFLIKPITNKNHLTTGIIADYCRVTHKTVLKWIRDGWLKGYKLPSGHYRIFVEDFRSFLNDYNMPIFENFFDRKRRVMLVDDEPEILNIISKILEDDSDNLILDLEDNGYSALLKMSIFRPHLVILDIIMPGIDGFEVCRSIKENPYTMESKILVVTGYPTIDNIKKIIQLGADDYLIKPINTKQLKKKVYQLLNYTGGS